MKNKLICISAGEMRGDCCYHKQYIPENPLTVRELCNYIISNVYQRGYIGINKGESALGDPRIEYYRGIYCDSRRDEISLNFSEQILNSQVKIIDWDGGWGRADWLITLK